MPADFWAGYLSGAVGIVIGNPLDLAKVRLQVGERTLTSAVVRPESSYGRFTSLVRGLCSEVILYACLRLIDVSIVQKA